MATEALVMPAPIEIIPSEREVSLRDSLRSFGGRVLDMSRQKVNDLRDGTSVRASLIRNNWDRPAYMFHVDDIDRVQRWGPVVAPYLIALSSVALSKAAAIGEGIMHGIREGLNNNLQPPNFEPNHGFAFQVEPSATPASPDGAGCYHLPEGESLWSFAYGQSETDPNGWGNWTGVLNANTHLPDLDNVTPQDCVRHPNTLPPEPTATTTVISPTVVNQPIPEAAVCGPHQVTVAEGDTFYSIAAEHEWNWQQAQNANPGLADRTMLVDECINPPAVFATPTSTPEGGIQPTVEGVSPQLTGAALNCELPHAQVTPVFGGTEQTYLGAYNGFDVDARVVYNGVYLQQLCGGAEDSSAHLEAYNRAAQYIVDKNTAQESGGTWELIKTFGVPAALFVASLATAGFIGFRKIKARIAKRNSG